MKRWAVGLPLMIALMACGSTPAAVHLGATTPSPSSSPVAVSPVSGGIDESPAPSPTAEPSASTPPSPAATSRLAYAVLVDLTSSAQTYTVSLVDADGRIDEQLTAGQRTPITTAAGHAIRLPYVSSTADSLYYLDGDSRLQVTRLTSRTVAIAPLQVPAGAESAFAVSPDDSTIAVSVLDFTKTPVHVTLYTADADTGDNKKVIFESDSDYVWPVAWHGGLLVLAHSFGPYEESIAPAAPARDNPYSAISYHLVDPATANRRVLMGACTVSGPLSPAGSGCIQGGSIDWQGNVDPSWSTTDWAQRSSAASLSPDGQWMAATNPNDPTQMGIWRRSDGLIANYVPGPGLHDWAGWIDDQTIIVGSEGGDWQPQVENVITGGIVHPVAARGFFAGLFPTNIV